MCTRLAVALSLALALPFSANAVVIDVYFGWNYVDIAELFPNPVAPPVQQLTSIVYDGGAGPGLVAPIPAFGGAFPLGMPDEIGLFVLPAFTTAVPVPIPAAVWLFGSALGLLGWMSYRARAK